jgi:hypothetical protein
LFLNELGHAMQSGGPLAQVLAAKYVDLSSRVHNRISIIGALADLQFKSSS